MNISDGNDMNSFTRHIFSPDPVARFQYEKVHGVKQQQADQEALRALMLAVLEDGIACFQGYYFQPSRTNEKFFREAEEWIWSEDESVFSFNTICEALGLDPGRLRKGLEQWKAKQTAIPWKERKRLILSKGKRAGNKRKAA